MTTRDPQSHPRDHEPAPALAPEPGTERIAAPEELVAMQNSPEFADLRRRFRSFAFPMTVAFIVWYFAYVLLSTYAVEFMSIPVAGTINVGLLLGLAQFATTFGITWLYVRHANRSLDPRATAIRTELEGRA